MPAQLIDGKAVAASVIRTVIDATEALKNEAGVTTGLAVIIVGDDPASHTYVGAKSRMAKDCGFTSIQHTLPVETTQQALMDLVANLNSDENVHGILVQLPLPEHLDSEAVVQSIQPDKDVDGLNVVNAGKVARVICIPVWFPARRRAPWCWSDAYTGMTCRA